MNRTRRNEQRRLIDATDVALCVGIPVSAAVAAVLPYAAHAWISRGIARVLPASFRRLAGAPCMARALSISLEEAQGIGRLALAARIEATLLFLRARSWGPPDGTVLEGGEHLDAALAGGRGVVLWIADLVFANDIPKIALAERGVRASHLSRPEHGFSATRFGMRWLNPIRQGFELRYLRERIVYDRNDPNAAGRTMRLRLDENGVVSILACAAEGRAFVESDFLGARLRMAGGAPRLAFEGGCALLPVFTAPAMRPSGFRVTIGAPLALDGADRREAAVRATADFLDRLEPMVRDRPHLWRGWPTLQQSSGPRETEREGAPALDAQTV